MAISPFSARPSSAGGEPRRARLALLIATLGIAATLLAYAVSPGVRHAVGHAAHSVKGAVSHVFDHDHPLPAAKRHARPIQPPRRAHHGSGRPSPSRGRPPAGVVVRPGG